MSERWTAPLSVTPTAFERQMRTMTARGLSSVTFTDAVLRPRARTVAVTFDDAFRSVLELGYPILSRLGMVASVFVPTDWPARSPEPMSWQGIDHWLEGPHRHENTPLDWDELGWLADRGWEIGSHTCTHPHLPELADAALEEELGRSKVVCTERLGRPCTSIAYPYGEHDPRVLDTARRCGYTAGCGLPRRLTGGDPLAEPRVGVYHGDDDRRFRIKVEPAVRLVRSSPLWPD